MATRRSRTTSPSTFKFGESNTITVKANHQTPSSRWYSGSGIGRDVDLVITDPVHVDRDGVVVTTPELSDSNKTQVKTHLKTVVTNKGNKDASVKVVQTVIPRGGTPEQAIARVESAATNIAAGAKRNGRAGCHHHGCPRALDPG